MSLLIRLRGLEGCYLLLRRHVSVTQPAVFGIHDNSRWRTLGANRGQALLAILVAMNATGRMGIGLIGDSPAGTVISQALGGAGHALVGRTLPPEDRREHVDAALPGVPVLEIPDLIRRSEMVILAAEGDALNALVESIEQEGLTQVGQLVVHLALDRNLAVLAPLVTPGIIPIRLYPLLPFTGTSVDLSLLRGGWCAVSAPTPVLPIAEALAIEMGLEPLVIDDAFHDTFVEVVKQLSESSMGFVSDAIDTWEAVGIDSAAAALSSLARAGVERVLRERRTDTEAQRDLLDLFDDSQGND